MSDAPNARATDLRAVARGDRPADVVVRGGRVFVAEREAYEEGDVLIYEDGIADVTSSGAAAVGPETDVVDATGGVVVPGFVDVHTHLDTLQAFEQSYVHALMGGTTTVVSETTRFVSRLGADGVTGFLDATADLPVRVLATLPPSPFYDEPPGQYPLGLDLDALIGLASKDRVVGVGEVFWNRVVDTGDDAPIERLVAAVREEGGVICGHGAGCHGEQLSAFATLVDNDHEILASTDVAERLHRGITPIGRYGSIRDDIDAFAAAAGDFPAGELCLCSDGMWPTELLTEGYMDSVVRRTIEAGVEPTTAFRMATLNAARRFGLDGIGSLTPGSVADVLVLADETRVDVETVIAGGDIVVRDGDPLVDYQPHEYPDVWYETVHVDVDEERFRVPVEDGGGPVSAVGYTEGLLSEETRVIPAVEGGMYLAGEAASKAALLPSGTNTADAGFTGFVTGLGLREGAVATSEVWGEPGVLVVGADEPSMVRAVARVAELDGGWVVVRDGVVAGELPTPVAGVCSAEPVETTRRRADQVRSALAEQGVDVEQPLLAVGTLAAGMPWFKLGSDGYVDVVSDELVGLRPGESGEANV